MKEKEKLTKDEVIHLLSGGSIPEYKTSDIPESEPKGFWKERNISCQCMVLMRDSIEIAVQTGEMYSFQKEYVK